MSEYTESSNSAQQTGKNRLIWVAAIFLIIAGFIAGGAIWYLGRHTETTDDAFSRADNAIISSKVPGRVAAVMAGNNDPVSAGDILFRIDDTDYRALEDAARAQVARAAAAISSLTARIAAAKARVAEAEAEILRTDAEAARATSDHARYASLNKTKHASAQRYEDARARKLSADASAAVARAQAEQARFNLVSLESDLDEARSAETAALAELALASSNLADTIVRAPINGIASNRRVEPGAWVQPGVAALAVVPLDKIYIEANFKETQLTNMRPGQNVRIAFDTWPGDVIHGHIETLSPASGAVFSLLPPQNASGNYTKIVQRFPVRIRIDDIPAHLQGRILAGMSATVSVDTASGGK